MKKKISFLVLSLLIIIASCSKTGEKLGGSPSPIGEEGVTFSTSSGTIAGVSNVSASVTELKGGVSSISGSAVVTNPVIKNILSNHPEAQINGNNVTVTDVEFRITTEGVESVYGLQPGIIVKYDAKVGDKYKVGDGITREVVARSTDNDYFWGGMLIKVIQVEENTNKFGVKKITYWANHRFGLVGMEFQFDDNSTAKFPIFASAQNN
ncbi:MAG TPA: hypothetical protein PKL65_00385 [Bacteroidales bacterium]|jgi:hypothetical protein|nr:hypothetical protein [Bacteroidales bacterium]HNR40661.1 hypothetical protein [Bacteroidales bacterium]HPM17709.1 hypothetical protein [Bacteroidales bacterium]